ncbi:excisionase family DNA-binding protein, partial [Streptomyces sp. NPDC054802]
MTSRRAQSGVSGFALTRLYRPAEVADALGCSEWWVKEQARKGRIPFTRTGGGYRFTAEHYQEIIRVFEERGGGGGGAGPPGVGGKGPRRPPDETDTHRPPLRRPQ